MSDETLEERQERFQEMAQVVTDSLELAIRLAASPDPAQRDLAVQQLPMWIDCHNQWQEALTRLAQQISKGSVPPSQSHASQ